MAYIYTNPHRQSLLATRQELQMRRQEREWIDQRIAQLEDLIRQLTPLAQDAQDTVSGTLPQLCLRVLGVSPVASQFRRFAIL